MSAHIGDVRLVADVVTHVHASTSGVEVRTEARLTYDPIAARNYAALLVRGADEVERMRVRCRDFSRATGSFHHEAVLYVARLMEQRHGNKPGDDTIVNIIAEYDREPVDG